jgi:hypothetical protein
MILLRRVLPQRSVKPLVVIVAALIGLFFGIGPAQAATPSVTISSDFVLPGNGTLIATGTAACGVPSGTATVQVSATETVWIPTNNPPYHIVSGTGSTTISCTGSSVNWTVSVSSGPFWYWAPGYFTTAKATLSQTGATTVSASTSGYPHY